MRRTAAVLAVAGVLALAGCAQSAPAEEEMSVASTCSAYLGAWEDFSDIADVTEDTDPEREAARVELKKQLGSIADEAPGSMGDLIRQDADFDSAGFATTHAQLASTCEAATD